MNIPSNFNTSVDELLELSNKYTIFLSNWDKSGKILNYPSKLYKSALINSIEYRNSYAFSDEIDDLKKCYLSTYDAFDIKKDKTRMAILSNGTCAAFLSIRALEEKVKHINVLVISPIYFSYLRLLSEMNVNAYFLQANINSRNSLPIDEIKQCIKKNNINLLIVNDPIFGTGISIKEKEYIDLSCICSEFNCYFLIDYIYGGMEWHKPINIVNKFLLSLSLKNKNIILIESISKRVFLNGMKNAVVVADSDIISRIEKSSVYLTGAMAYSQLVMFEQLYSRENRNIILDLLSSNLRYSENNYIKLKKYLKNTNFKLSNCESGYFCLLGIPKANSSLSSFEIAKNILNDSNILLLPHDRYLYFSNDYYYFRLNLVLEEKLLMLGVDKLIKSYNSPNCA